MVDLNSIAANLELHSDGIWYAKHQSPIAYPEDGNNADQGYEFFFALGKKIAPAYE